MKSAETMWDYVRESALEEGMEKGIEQVMEKGREEERKKIVLEMLKNNVDIRFICKWTGLTQKEVKKLKND